MYKYTVSILSVCSNHLVLPDADAAASTQEIFLPSVAQ